MTVAEQSGYMRTGRYDEVAKLCAAFAQAWSSRVRCVEFGRTPENRIMRALVASDDGALDAATARQRNRPVVLMQGGIHAGEIDGKDAGFLALRDMLEGKAAPGALAARSCSCRCSTSTATSGSAAGTAPISAAPRRWAGATTAQNLNLNRDYVKADAPEMQAMLRLLGEWDPILLADLHVTDGAEFEHDVSLTVAPSLAATRSSGGGRRTSRRADAPADGTGSLPLDVYPSSCATTIRARIGGDHQPDAVLAAVLGDAQPARRPRRDALLEGLPDARARDAQRDRRDDGAGAERGDAWRAAVQHADARAMQIGGSTVPLTFTNTDHVKTIDFRGYAYTRSRRRSRARLATPTIRRAPRSGGSRCATRCTAARPLRRRAAATSCRRRMSAGA
jgi:hypothetical protein